MNCQQAIEELQDMKDAIRWDDFTPPSFDVAILALEKQIPKKPIKKEWDNICPTCGHLLIDDAEDVDVYYPYCFRCGQRLDWSDEQ